MSFEFILLDALQALRCPVLDALAVFFDQAGAHGEIWIAFTLLLLLFRRTRRAGFAMAVALVLALALAGCAPKDAGVAILTGLDKKELAQGDLPCRSYYEGETLMVPLCEVARALGYSAEWDSANQTAIIDDEYIQKATLTAGSKTTLFEGHLQVINMSREVELAEALTVQEGTPYVPAEFFTEFLNEVEYGEGIVTIAPSVVGLDDIGDFLAGLH